MHSDAFLITLILCAAVGIAFLIKTVQDIFK